MAEIFGDDAALAARWRRSIELAAAMTDDESVAMGTRYDALRMLGCDTWAARGGQLSAYLKKGVHDELAMGAVSGAGDIDEPPAVEALLDSLAHLSPGNRNLALDALLRSTDRAKRLLERVAAGKVAAATLGDARIERLKNYDDAEVRRIAAQALP